MLTPYALCEFVSRNPKPYYKPEAAEGRNASKTPAKVARLRAQKAKLQAGDLAFWCVGKRQKGKLGSTTRTLATTGLGFIGFRYYYLSSKVVKQYSTTV